MPTVNALLRCGHQCGRRLVELLRFGQWPVVQRGRHRRPPARRRQGLGQPLRAAHTRLNNLNSEVKQRPAGRCHRGQPPGAGNRADQRRHRHQHRLCRTRSARPPRPADHPADRLHRWHGGDPGRRHHECHTAGGNALVVGTTATKVTTVADPPARAPAVGAGDPGQHHPPRPEGGRRPDRWPAGIPRHRADPCPG